MDSNRKLNLFFINKKSEPLFSKKNRALLSDPLDDNNPITVQVLGICSALAITVQLKPALVMTLSVVFVMGASNVIISIFRLTKYFSSNTTVSIWLIVNLFSHQCYQNRSNMDMPMNAIITELSQDVATE